MRASQMQGMGSFAQLRGLRRDRSVLQASVTKGTVKRILATARPYRRVLTGFLALVLLDAMLGAVNPLLLRAIIDKGILGGDRGLVVQLAAIAAGLAVVGALIGLGERWLSASIGESLILDLRSQVFDHVQRMPLAFFVRTQTGALVSRLNHDVVGAQQAFTDLLSNMVGNVIGVAIVLGAMAVLSWQVTLIALLLLPMFLIPARFVGQRLGGMTRSGMDLNAKMNMSMQERFGVGGAMLVKLYGDPDHESEEFHARAAAVRDIGVTQALYSRIFFVALSLTAALATAFTYGYGGLKVIDGVLAVGTLVALTAYLGRLYGPLTALSNLQLDVMTAVVSFERLFEVLDLEPSLKAPEHPRPLPPGPARLEFSHVAFSYPTAEEVSLASLEAVATLEDAGAEEVISDLDFVAEPGQVVALVGPSGAGKTTTSMLAARLYDPTRGEVRLNGVDLRELDPGELRRAVGVVTQDPHLFHDTLGANLRYGNAEASDEEVREALARAQVLDLVDRLPDGLDTLVGERGYRLSGGEKQRIAIARVLLAAPRLLVLDEATAHLDAENEVKVTRALSEALEGRTALVIAHRLSTVRDADQILVVDGGRVAERGTHDQLLAAGGLYAELFATQFAGQEPS